MNSKFSKMHIVRGVFAKMGMVNLKEANPRESQSIFILLPNVHLMEFDGIFGST